MVPNSNPTSNTLQIQYFVYTKSLHYASLWLVFGPSTLYFLLMIGFLSNTHLARIGSR